MLKPIKVRYQNELGANYRYKVAGNPSFIKLKIAKRSLCNSLGDASSVPDANDSRINTARVLT